MYMSTYAKKFLPLMVGYFLPVALGIIPLKEKNIPEIPVQISFNYKGIVREYSCTRIAVLCKMTTFVSFAAFSHDAFLKLLLF